MEITEIKIIGDFEAGIKCLQNPTLFSCFSPVSKLPQLYSFWKWGALIIVIFATFTSVINRITLLIYRIRFKSFVSSVQNPNSHQLLEDDDYDFDYSDDDCLSASADSDDEEFDESEDDRKTDEEVFRVAGSSCFWEERCQNGNGKLRRRNRFSWSDFSAGKNVVQLWDSFGLGLDFEEDSYRSEIAVWDLDSDVKLSSGRRCQVPPENSTSSAVILSAEMNDNNSVVLGAYDTRVGSKVPAIYAAWKPRQGKTPSEKLTESDGDTWWDADAVIGQDE